MAIIVPNESSIAITDAGGNTLTDKLKIVAATVQLDAQLQDVTGLGDKTLIMQLGGMVIAKGQLVVVALQNAGLGTLDVFKGKLNLATDDGGSINSDGVEYTDPDGTPTPTTSDASPTGNCWFMQKQVTFSFGSNPKRHLVPMVLNFIMGNPKITAGSA